MYSCKLTKHVVVVVAVFKYIYILFSVYHEDRTIPNIYICNYFD